MKRRFGMLFGRSMHRYQDRLWANSVIPREEMVQSKRVMIPQLSKVCLMAIKSGETLLDVGCGAGFDLIVASRMAGKDGKVCGIDLTPEMTEKARNNLEHYKVQNYDIQVAGAEHIPHPDNTFDVVISNGVLNLSPLKEKCFREIYRVLKANGRLQFADIVLKENCAGAMCSTLEAWSN
jgi:arsenite methyltransferase